MKLQVLAYLQLLFVFKANKLSRDLAVLFSVEIQALSFIHR